MSTTHGSTRRGERPSGVLALPVLPALLGVALLGAALLGAGCAPESTTGSATGSTTDAATGSATQPQSPASPEAADDKSGIPLAVTIDDLPSSAGMPLDELEAMTSDLLDQLAARGVASMGFVNSSKLVVAGEEEAREELLGRWLEAGHDLGNHTARHSSLHQVPLEDYLRDIEDGETPVRALLEERGATLRYFRHPYLHAGLDLETKNAVETWLAEHGYVVAPVTLENHDWMFAAVYRRRLAEGDEQGAAKVAESYLTFSRRQFTFWEPILEQLGGRAHVLLLHANRLNADHFGALADILEERGYRYASLDEVMEDPVYSRPDDYAGPGGVLWPFRWAKTAGLEIDWRREPTPPEWIVEAFEAGG